MKNIFFILIILLIYSCDLTEDNKGSSITENMGDDPISALDSLSQNIVNDPNNSNTYYQRGLYFYDEGEFDQALNDINRALEVDSMVAQYHYVKGNIYYDDKRFKEAFSSYQKSIELDEEHVNAILKLSQIELILKNYDLAIEMVNKALRLDPMNPVAYYLKGFIYLDARDSTTAISTFQTAIEVDPNYYDAYIILGKVYSDVNPDFAESYYKQAIEIQGENIEALYNIGVFYQDYDRYLECYPIYDKIIALDSSAYFAYYNKGYVLLVSDSSYTEAIDQFEKALLFYPYYHQAYYNIGLCYENLGDLKSAEKNYRKSLEINPQFDLAARGLSRILE